MGWMIDFGNDSSRRLRRNVFEEVMLEREKQDTLWGDRMDDENTTPNWVFYITGYLGNLYRDRQPFRDVMIRVAALAIAAIEAHDRKNQ